MNPWVFIISRYTLTILWSSSESGHPFFDLNPFWFKLIQHFLSILFDNFFIYELLIIVIYWITCFFCFMNLDISQSISTLAQVCKEICLVLFWSTALARRTQILRIRSYWRIASTLIRIYCCFIKRKLEKSSLLGSVILHGLRRSWNVRRMQHIWSWSMLKSIIFIFTLIELILAKWRFFRFWIAFTYFIWRKYLIFRWNSFFLLLVRSHWSRATNSRILQSIETWRSIGSLFGNSRMRIFFFFSECITNIYFL